MSLYKNLISFVIGAVLYFGINLGAAQKSGKAVLSFKNLNPIAAQEEKQDSQSIELSEEGIAIKNYEIIEEKKDYKEKEIQTSNSISPNNLEKAVETAYLEKPYSEEIKKSVLLTRLTFDGFAGERGLVGLGAGIGHGPVNFLINLAKKSEDNFISSGVALEIYPFEYFFIGGGLNQWNHKTKSQTEYSRRFYGGFEVPIKNTKFKIRVFGGHDSKEYIFGGIGGSYTK